MCIEEPDEVGGSSVDQSESTNDLLEKQHRKVPLKDVPGKPDAGKLRLKLANMQEFEVDLNQPSYASHMPEQHTVNKTHTGGFQF